MPETLAPGARGRLVSFTVIRKAPAAFVGEPLYAVAIVDLDGGRRMVGRLEPFEPAPALGSAVRLVRFLTATPVFAPA